MGHVVRVADWQRRPVGARDSSGRRDTGPFLPAAFSASAVGFSSSGMLAAVRWTERGLELHTVVTVLLGVAVLGGVAALVRFLDLQHGSAGNDDANDEVAIPGDDAGEGTHVTVHRTDDDWAVRIHRLETVAESTRGASTRDEAAADAEEIRDAIDEAGLRTIRTAAIRLFEDDDGSWRWSLVHSNGTTLATAARAAENRTDARDAVTTLTDHGADAAVLDAGSVAFVVVRRDGRWYWQLLDAGRTPLAESAAGYADPERADAAIDPFLDALAAARVMTVDPIAIELYDDGDEWSWRFVDEANDVVADATGGFDTRRDAETAADAVRSGLETAAVTVAGEPAYERYRDDDGWHWRLLDGTDRVVARKPDGASKRDDAARTAELFAEHAPGADVLELEEAAFEVFPERGPTVPGSEEPTTTDDRIETRTDGASPTAAETAGDASSERPSDADVSSAGTTATAESVDEAIPESGDQSMDDSGDSTVGRGPAPDSDPDDDAAGDVDGWYWRLVTTQRDVVAVGPDPAATPEAVDDAIDRVREQAREADLIEFDDAAFRVYETGSGEWR